MPRLPAIIWVGIVIQVVPILAHLSSRRRTRAGLVFALACTVSLCADMISLVMSSVAANNHIVTYLSSPIFAVLLLAGLREWQLTPLEHRVFSGGMLLFLLSIVPLTAFLEDISTFNRGIGPLYSLALLAGGLWTLGRRAWAVEIAPLQQSDWFWGATGLAVYGGSTALASPIGGYLLAQGRSDLVIVAWEIRAVLVTVAFLLLGWGIYRGPMVSKFSTLEQSEAEIV